MVFLCSASLGHMFRLIIEPRREARRGTAQPWYGGRHVCDDRDQSWDSPSLVVPLPPCLLVPAPHCPNPAEVNHLAQDLTMVHISERHLCAVIICGIFESFPVKKADAKIPVSWG